MSDHADGSIVIDTELDNDGFSKGSEKLLSAIRDLSGKIENIGSTVEKSFSTVCTMLQDLASKSSSVYEKTASSATQATDANARFASSMGEAEQTVTSTARAASSYEAALAKVQKQIETQKAKLSEYYAQMEQIKQSTNETLKHAETEEQVTHVLEMEEIEVQKLNEKYAAQIKTLVDLEAEYQRVSQAASQTSRAAAQMPDANIPSPDSNDIDMWAKLREGIKSAASHLLKLGVNMAKISFRALSKGVSSFVSGLKSMSSQSKTASLQANALVKSLLSLKNMLIARIKRTFISDIFNSARESMQLLAVYSNSFNRAMSNIKNASAQLSANIAASLGGLIEKIEPVLTRVIDGISRAITYVSAFFGIISGKNTMLVAKKQTDSYRNSLYGVSNQAASASSNLNSASSAASSYGNSLGSVSDQSSAYNRSTRDAARGTDSYAGSAEEAAEAVKELNRQQYGFDELNKRNASDIDDNVDALDDLADSLANTYDPSNYDPYNGDTPTNPTDTYDPYGGLDPQAVQDAADMFEEVPIDSILPEKLSNLFDELKKLWENGDYFNFGKLLGEGFNNILQGIDDWINNVFRPNGVKWARIVAEVLNGLVAGVDWKLLGKTIADGLNSIIDIINTFFDTFDFESFGKGLGQAIRSWFDTVDWTEIGKAFANRWNALIDTIHGIVTTPGIWKSIGSSIAEFITTALMEIDFPKLGETIAAGFEGLMFALKSAAKVFQERSDEISTLIATGINNAVKGVDWADAAKSIGSFVSSILDTLLETVRKTDWVAVGRAIGDFLGNIPWGKILGDVAAIIWEVASGVIAGLFDTGSGKVIMAIGAGILAVKGLFDAAAIAGTVATWVNAIGTAFPAALPAVTTFASGIATALGGIIPAATSVVSGLGAALAPIASVIFSPTGLIITAVIAAVALIIANWDKIKTAATQLAEWIGQAWGTIKTYTVEKWDSLKTTVSQKAGEIRTSVVNAWSNLETEAGQKWEEVKTAVSDKFSQIKPVVTTTAEGIKTSLKNSWDNVKQTTQTAWSNLSTTVKTEFEKVKTPVDNTLKTVKQNLSTNWTNIKTDTQRAWDNIKTTITQPIQRLPQTITPAGNQVRDAFQRIWSGVNTTSQGAWRTILRGLSSMWSSVQSGLSSMFSYVSSGLSSLLSRAQQGMSNAWNAVQSLVSGAADLGRSAWNGMKQVGSYIGQGLQNGISSAKRGVYSAIDYLTGGSINRANTNYRIGSPSKVFAEIGKFLDLGLALGIDKYERNVLSSISNMAENVADEVDTNGVAFKIGTESDGTVAKLSNIADRLSNIANVFREINNTLTSMGGLNIPVIATGTAVPYSARISPVARGGSFNMSDLPGCIDDSERIYTMVSLLRQILERLERNGRINNDDLAAAIAFALRGESRGFGAV